MSACNASSLKSAPNFHLKLAVGDSLLHGERGSGDSVGAVGGVQGSLDPEHATSQLYAGPLEDRHHIVNALGWRELRPFQEQVIPHLLEGKHMIVLAPTAGGKTECAIFPVLSKMLEENWQGLSVLYCGSMSKERRPSVNGISWNSSP